MSEYRTYVFYQASDYEGLEEDELTEAAPVFLVKAKSAQEALDLFSDEITLDSDDVKEYRVTELLAGKRFTKKLAIVD